MRMGRMDGTVMKDSFHSLLERLAAVLDLDQREVFYQTGELRIGAVTVGLRPAARAGGPGGPVGSAGLDESIDSAAPADPGRTSGRSGDAGDSGFAGITLHTHWPAPAPAVKAATHRLLLEANFLWVGTGGATLAVNPANGEIAMALRVAPDIDPAVLAATLERFAQLAHLWTESSAALAAEMVAERAADPATLRTVDAASLRPGATWLIRG